MNADQHPMVTDVSFFEVANAPMNRYVYMLSFILTYIELSMQILGSE